MTRCFLKTESHFIWMFSAPVIAIFVTNITIFVATICKIWLHKKKSPQMQNTLHSVIYWLKGTISLTVVMGLTWTAGLLVVVEENLLFLVYIHTILVAFQGLFIFILFIVFADSVQNVFKKCWTRKSFRTISMNLQQTSSQNKMVRKMYL